MRKIPKRVYDKLSLPERIGPMIAAMARGDMVEQVRLGTGPEIDAEISDLQMWALAVEADRRESLCMFFASYPRNEELVESVLQRISDLDEAQAMALERLGIDPEDFAEIAPPPSALSDMIAGLLPPPDPENSERLAREIGVICG